LRTYDVDSPFPEEFNRQAIDKIAYYNWAPSKSAVKNLLSENIRGKIILTGNTIVDFVNQMTIDKDEFYKSDEIVITLHRRENEKLFKSILTQICEISQEYCNLKFVFPAHPNPIIQNKLDGLATSNFKITPPMKYEKFLTLLARCRGIITDSGGIQEEALCLNKRVLICRSNTERPEGVNIGLCKLIGSEVKKNFKWLLKESIIKFENPYGDGTACNKIIESIEVV
jgi:UDP-N-acetylglucosamine 2-epimerase (non-hydrolysing)